MRCFLTSGKRAVSCFTVLMVALVMNGATESSFAADDTPVLAAGPFTVPPRNTQAATAPFGVASAGPQVDISAAYNRIGIYTDGTTFPAIGGLDTHGFAYSANLLGPVVSWNGSSFNLGPANAPNVISAAGQTLPLPPGKFFSLVILATAVNGKQTGQTFTVHYSDGSSDTNAVDLNDWANASYIGTGQVAVEGQVAVTMRYRDSSNGTKNNGIFYLYGYTVLLNYGRTVTSLTLPNNSSVEVAAVALAQPVYGNPVDIFPDFTNRPGIYSDGTKFGSGLDGQGYAYSYNLLGDVVYWNGNSLHLSPFNGLNAISTAGQKLGNAIAPGKFSSLLMLAAGVNGNQADQTFTIGYADGSTSSFTQSLSDWATPQHYPQESIAATMPYRNFRDGTRRYGTIYLYGYSFALDNTKDLNNLILPNNSNVVVLAITLANGSASRTSVLPHFAVGGSFATDFYIVNCGFSPANFSISFYGDNGSPVAVPYGSASVTTLSDTVPAGGSEYYEVGTPQGQAASGSAMISSDPSITIQALFRRQGSDGAYDEAAVPAASGSNEIEVTFDATTFSGNGAQIYTGLAIANLDTSNTANVSCTARDSAGNVIPNAIPAQSLNPLGHWANYVFPALTGQRGTLDCTSNTQIGAIGVRALGNALSSLPVITLPISNAAGTKVLPHFAVGGSFVSDFYVVNSGSNRANFSISFHDDNGHPITLPFAGLGNLSTLSGSIPARGAGFYEAGTPQGTLLSGSAVISSDPSITIQALFRRQGSDGSYCEAAVPAATGSNEIEVPFDATTFGANGAQIYTGLAIANLDTSNTANVSCTARDSAGNVIPNAIPAQSLNPLGHWANYVFPALTGQRGTLDCTSNTQIGAVGIRALGNALSSLPVITQ
jgi:hypothetical protein